MHRALNYAGTCVYPVELGQACSRNTGSEGDGAIQPRSPIFWSPQGATFVFAVYVQGNPGLRLVLAQLSPTGSVQLSSTMQRDHGLCGSSPCSLLGMRRVTFVGHPVSSIKAVIQFGRNLVEGAQTMDYPLSSFAAEPAISRDASHATAR